MNKKIFTLLLALTVLLGGVVYGQKKSGVEQKNSFNRVDNKSVSTFNINLSLIGLPNFFASKGTVAYGWNAYGGSVAVGPITIEVPEGTMTSIAASDVDFIAGADFVEDVWYGVQYADGVPAPLVTINTTTGALTTIGGGANDLVGFAYDAANEISYVIDFYGELSTIDLATGAVTSIGGYDADNSFIGLACSGDGVLYGIALDDNLYTINPATGASTLVGALGVNINYAQDIAYDRDNDVLYGTLYTSSGGLYSINTTTGAATLLLDLVSEVTGFAIPYTLADPSAPGAATALTAVAGSNGALTADVSWTNPALTFDDNTLTDLDSVKLFCDGVEIFENLTPTIGGNETFDATVLSSGFHTFKVIGYNDMGAGANASVTIFIGEDVPGAPTSVVLEDDGNGAALITWVAPTVGANGEYFTGTGLTYDVIRVNDLTVVASDISALTYTDNTVGLGTYVYAVIAYNAQGEGDFGLSNEYLFGQIVFDENFDSGLPTDWTVGTGDYAWAVISDYDGYTLDGTSFAFVDSDAAGSSVTMDETMETPVINAAGLTKLVLEFDQFFRTWSGADVADVDVFDGTEWVNVYTTSATVGMFEGPDHQSIDVTDYINANFKVRFHYYDANWEYYWAVDNVVLLGEGEMVETFEITFNIDMMGDNTEFDAATQEVYMSGDVFTPVWPQPGTNAAAEMLDADEDGIYTLVLNLEAGSYEYKTFWIEAGTPSWDHSYTDNLALEVSADATIDAVWVWTNSVNELNSNTKVYPNPSKGIYNINVEGTYNVKVIDVTGKVVSTSTINASNNTIDITSQPAGLYFIELSGDSRMNFNVVKE